MGRWLREKEELTEFEEGFFLGILVGEGHFESGRNQRTAQVTVKMHVRHTQLFHWLSLWMPGSALYGPYHHGGRAYCQWMVRGKALREELVPFLRLHLDRVDSHTRERITRMIEKYRL